MIRRNTWIVLALLIVFLGLAWYLEWSPASKSRPRGGTPTPTEQPYVLDIAPQDLALIELQSADQSLILRRSPDNTWHLDGTNSPVEQGTVQQIEASLFTLKNMNQLDPTIDLTNLGLAQSTTTIILQTTQSAKYEIKIGSTTPTQSGYYVRVGEKAPLVISKNAVDDLLNLLKVDKLILSTPTPPEATESTAAPQP